MMPEMDGQEALKAIRNLEQENGIGPDKAAKIVMTSALEDSKNVMTAFNAQCEAYLVKPIDGRKLQEHLRKLGLVD